MAEHPTATGTMITWLSGVVPAVASNLPALDSWPVLSGTVRGFVTVPTVAGGTVEYAGLRVPVLQVETWAAVPSSDRPQYGAAEQLAEDIVAAVNALNATPAPVLVRQRVNYLRAMIQCAPFMTEPRRLDDPDTGYARFLMDLALAWTEVPD
ncbi:MAG TPA: hypothetical protein VFP10_12375 [Candidatus Eisenbacteria bacterium]|nr:hypothetical protein [Candidatus Eisenbacteria bacterium]